MSKTARIALVAGLLLAITIGYGAGNSASADTTSSCTQALDWADRITANDTDWGQLQAAAWAEEIDGLHAASMRDIESATALINLGNDWIGKYNTARDACKGRAS